MDGQSFVSFHKLVHSPSINSFSSFSLSLSLSLCVPVEMDVYCRFSLIIIYQLAALVYLCPCPSIASQYTVGDDSVWSIPLTNDFYTNWSSSHSFHTGDSLLFEFESELHNVMQVSRREYESCTANRPFKAFTNGSAVVPLMEDGVFYFICSVSNYCALGQKLTVIVNESSPSSASFEPSTHSESMISGQSPPLSACTSQMPSSAAVCYCNAFQAVVLCLVFGWFMQ